MAEAASLRLRPILMTTGPMVLGARCRWPRPPAPAPKAASRLAGVIVGGMSLGTLLTLFVVPTVYSLFARSRVPGANRTVVAEGLAVG